MDSQLVTERARSARIVPVLTINEAKHAVSLARALVAGGLDVLEVTLRTDAALEAIRLIAEADIDCVIGAGTIVSEEDIAAARDAGAAFLVTPGSPLSLLPALAEYDGLTIPGASTATEVMTLLDAGYAVQKFFPAEASGGVKFLKGVGGPLPQVSFMPTGGVNVDNVQTYLELPNVLAAGGTWIAPAADVDAEKWDLITERAKAAKAIAAG